MTELTTPPRKRRAGIIALAGVAVLALALGAAGVVYGLSQNNADGDQPPAAAAAATMSVERQMECTGIKRGYDAWISSPISIGSLPDVEGAAADFVIKESMEDGKTLLKAVEGYDDQPSKALAVAVAEYNVEVSMLNVVFGLSGKYDDADYKKTIAAKNKVRDAYNFFWAQTCT